MGSGLRGMIIWEACRAAGGRRRGSLGIEAGESKMKTAAALRAAAVSLSYEY